MIIFNGTDFEFIFDSFGYGIFGTVIGLIGSIVFSLLNIKES